MTGERVLSEESLNKLDSSQYKKTKQKHVSQYKKNMYEITKSGLLTPNNISYT